MKKVIGKLKADEGFCDELEANGFSWPSRAKRKNLLNSLK